MIFCDDVLSEPTISEIKNEVISNFTSNSWEVASLSWNKNILVNLHGYVYIKIVSDALHKKIVNEISPLVPSYDTISSRFYIWDKGSGISSHNDSNYKWAATIYLTPNWHLDYGGLFIWENKDTKKLETYLPTFNSMVINSNKELHLVTPVMTDVDKRVTVQVWGT